MLLSSLSAVESRAVQGTAQISLSCATLLTVGMLDHAIVTM